MPAALPGSPGLDEEGVPGRPGGLDKVGRPGVPGDDDDEGEEGMLSEPGCDGMPPELGCDGVDGVLPGFDGEGIDGIEGEPLELGELGEGIDGELLGELWLGLDDGDDGDDGGLGIPLGGEEEGLLADGGCDIGGCCEL